MSTHTVNQPTVTTTEPPQRGRVVTFLDLHSPTLFLGGYLLGLGGVITGLLLTGHLHG